ncbi:unnamed protein product, partial [Hapterophycus canaliculatus]
DWCVNKRRVKRLLRSMNNDAWKAAVNPTVTAGNPAPARGGSDVAGTPSSYSSAETDAPPPPPPAAATETATTRSSSRAAAKAAKAAEKAVNGVEASGSDEQEALSESLDLKPDLELEPGVDLTADLGIVTNIAAAAAAALTTEGIPECDAADTLSAGGDIGVSGRSEAADNLGFEMIDKAEVVGAAAAAAAAASSSSSTTPSAVGAGSDSGAASTGKFRKGWPWAWTRSS